MMTPERWQRIQDMFDHLHDKSPSHRRDYLAMTCEGDEALRVELESLLKHHDALEQTQWLKEGTQNQTCSIDGDLLGRYRIKSLLGEGGMGRVYRAEMDGVQFALKVLPGNLLTNEHAQTRFAHEADTLSQIRHPNICNLVEVFRSSADDLVIVLEYSPGRSLQDILSQKAKQSLAFSLEVIDQLTSALHQAHARNIFHRDIKPGNILVEGYPQEQPIVKLIDFGIAKHADTHLTRTGMLIGTPSYMAPEQWQGKTVGAATDIWALGVLLIKMVTGSLPFSGDNSFEKMEDILKRDLSAQFDRIAQECGDAFASLLAVMLTKDPTQRLHSCIELSRRIKKIRGG